MLLKKDKMILKERNANCELLVLCLQRSVIRTAQSDHWR